MLRNVWTAPQHLDPARRAARVTKALAENLAELSKQLEEAGHASEQVAQFLMRCLFTMFAEDVALIPEASFSGMLKEYRGNKLKHLPHVLQNLWERMDKGGFSSELHELVPRFNGKLFHDATALPLNADQMELLLKAAAADWNEVEPAIFGT